MKDTEPFGSLYAMRQQREMQRRVEERSSVEAVLNFEQQLRVERLRQALFPRVNGARCPENPALPATSCQWHCHQTERANLAYRDKAFYFTTQARVPGTEIRSPGQWKRFLKRHNLTDDLSIKDHMDMVSRDYAGKKRKERVEKLTQEARKVFSQHAYESTVYKH